MFENFWDNVKVLLRMKEITMRELAEKTGLNFHSLYNSVSKQILPSVESLYKLANAFDVSMEYLLTGIDKYNPSMNIENLKKKYIEIKKAEYESELTRKLDRLSELK